MPTENPRVNVTLSVSLDQLVTRLATHTRVSKSQVLRELLEAAEPGLHRAVALMDAASVASKEVRSRLAGRIERGLEMAEDTTAALLSRLDRTTADLVSQAEAVRGKRPARVADAAAAAPARAAGASARKNPPASNRGVKSPSRRTTGGKNVAAKSVRRSR